MEIDKLMLTRPVTSVELESIEKVRRQGEQIDLEDAERKKVAKDFESIFIHQIMKEMKNTIPESDLEDSSSKEIKNMYWSFMAQAVAERGGFGLWEHIYEQMPRSAETLLGDTSSENNSVRLDDSV